MPDQKNMSVFTARSEAPYIVDDDLAQLLLDSRAEPESQDVITECAPVFETMNIRTVRKDGTDHGEG